MQALFVVLNNPGLLDVLFSAFINIGITRATCIESVGMGRSISEMDMTSVPIFSFLRHHLNESRPFNNTVFTLIADDQVDAAMQAVEEVVGDLSMPGTGLAFTIPVGRAMGFPK